MENNEKINVVVPTGNFGNILAAYYAKEMGLPVNKFICASNENNVLYDFIKTGVYDKHRKFKITASPSMDILISSNLERLNYYLSKKNEETLLGLMKKLNSEGKYEVTEEMKEGLKNFYGGFATDKETLESIKEMTQGHLVDGIIMLRVREHDESVEYLKNANFPFVVIGRPEYPDEVLWVDNNNFQAMYKVVNKLIQKGHRKIGFVGAIKNLNMSKDRYKGYEKALKMNGIELDESIVIHKDEFKECEGQNSCRELIENKDLTAIVSTDDILAFGIMKELRSNKIKNISVIGFNNTQLAQYQKPPLASVDINADKLGYQAARLLINTLEEKHDDNRHYIVNTEFVERESFI